ncbi:hypothetical protein [Archangium violaceum]|uniref:hypothetical protein n=1 Tax=Archangium violaceum TaxID=83451 RepID=UPI0036DA1DD5
MKPREPTVFLMLATAVILFSCIRRWEAFSTPVQNDRSIIFPLSVGGGFVEINAQEKTYQLDGEVLRALVIVINDLFPPDVSKLDLSCRVKQEAHTFRFTRRDDIIFVYVNENPAYCGRTAPALDSGAKYAISKDGRILRRVIDGMDEDDHLWLLKKPDGGAVIVATKEYDSPSLEDLDKPDSGILKIITEPWDMPDTFVIEPSSSPPVPEGNGVVLGMSFMPYDGGELPRPPGLDGGTPDAGLDAGTPDGGSPGDAGSGPLSAPPSPPDAGAAAP